VARCQSEYFLVDLSNLRALNVLPTAHKNLGNELQAGRSRVRFSMVSLEFFIDIILPATLWPRAHFNLWQKLEPAIYPGG